MSRCAAALLVAMLLSATTAVAQAQEGPQPLWVPDPQDQAAAVSDAAAPAVEVVVPAGTQVPAANDPSQVALAHWLADGATTAGLPPELPVMAALVESGLRNLPYGDRDSVGMFQMRLSIWNRGEYEGYLARPELQLRWFVTHAIAVRDARRAAGAAAYGEDPATWGEWIADVEGPAAPFRGRYQLRLDEARALLALPAPAVAPFELGLTVGGPANAGTDEAAQQVLADPRITLDPRARGDLVAGRVDPRLSAVLLEAAAREPISIWVFQTGHSYRTVNGSVSNHSFGRAADIGSVGGEVVTPKNGAAKQLALALGRLPAEIRPTEIGSPWAIDDPAYFTDGDHQDHLHVGFDDPVTSTVAAAVLPALATAEVPVAAAARRSSERAEPSFKTGASAHGDRSEPSFKTTAGTP